MADVRPRVLEFEVVVDESRVAYSSLGGSPLPREAEWWAEHLVLAGLVRCTLASMDYAARRAGANAVGSGRAHGRVTRRPEDGSYGFVEIEAVLDVRLAPAPDADTLRDILDRAERGCFVSNSLRPRPRHRWVVNGREVAEDDAPGERDAP
ncbi:MAG TPA: OsmC family protein [Gaiellaceae bacterium]|nr:OsmC family protein [Gaiellaceae bacterium]